MDDGFLNGPQQQIQRITEVFEWDNNDASDIDSSDDIVNEQDNRKGSLPSASDYNQYMLEQNISGIYEQKDSKTIESLNIEMQNMNGDTMLSNPEITVINKTIYSNKCFIAYIIILNLLLLYVVCGVTYLLLNNNNGYHCECKNINIQSPTDTYPTTNLTVINNDFVGDLKISIQNQSHGNWLLCDASFINKNEYPHLFNILGYKFGMKSGNHSLFQLPNGSGKIIGIIDHVKYNIGDIVGNENIVLTTDNMPTHNHFVASGITDYVSCNANYFDGQYSYLADDCNVTNGLLDSIESKYQLKATDQIPNRFRSGNSGLGISVNIMQPTIFVGNLFVYAG